VFGICLYVCVAIGTYVIRWHYTKTQTTATQTDVILKVRQFNNFFAFFILLSLQLHITFVFVCFGRFFRHNVFVFFVTHKQRTDFSTFSSF